MQNRTVYIISDKRLQFEFFGSEEELIEMLIEDDITSCKIKTKFTNRKMKARKNMFGVIKLHADY